MNFKTKHSVIFPSFLIEANPSIQFLYCHEFLDVKKKRFENELLFNTNCIFVQLNLHIMSFHPIPIKKLQSNICSRVGKKIITPEVSRDSSYYFVS